MSSSLQGAIVIGLALAEGTTSAGDDVIHQLEECPLLADHRWSLIDPKADMRAAQMQAKLTRVVAARFLWIPRLLNHFIGSQQ